MDFGLPKVDNSSGEGLVKSKTIYDKKQEELLIM
jgi:hypothetical protein